MMPVNDGENNEQEFPESVVDEMLDSDYGPDNSDVEDDDDE
jgi:hypothetical protein